MKTVAPFLLLFVVFSAFNCQRNNRVKPPFEPSGLVGKWQLTEYYQSIGGPATWTKADSETPIIIEFTADGVYTSNRDNCQGQYTWQADQAITVNVTCTSGTRTIQYQIRQSSSEELVLTPTNPICIEGCAEKYRAIR